METCNGKIASTTLGIEDHSILTFFVHLEFDGCGQGLGGYALDHRDRETRKLIGHGSGLVAIRRILEVVGVSNWEDLKGKLVRVRHDGIGSKPIIGHILEDRWFDLGKFMQEAAD